jgi:hypothetical protein
MMWLTSIGEDASALQNCGEGGIRRVTKANEAVWNQHWFLLTQAMGEEVGAMEGWRGSQRGCASRRLPSTL